jgi:adenylosuccinate synthase
VGTTGRGIGPSYSDKAARLGIRMNDLIDDDMLREKLEFLIPLKQRILDAYGDPTRLDLKAIHNEYAQYGRKLKQYVTDTGVLIEGALVKRKKVLFEGAQGSLLDIDHGTYPFVTSSTTVSGNAASGSGISPLELDDVYGVVKAYTTRVGEGPFPTELSDNVGKRIAEKGGEFGTTTGRARRCGWLDLVITKYSSRLSGFTGIAMTKIDVLSGFDELNICTHYSLDGKRMTTIPSDLRILQKCEPRYKTIGGWDELDDDKMKKILSRGFAELPPNMKEYVKFVEKEMGVPVAILGLGRRRNETLDLRKKKWGKR